MTKKKILFVFPRMTVGGATTNALAVLAELCGSGEYEADLLLLQNTGPLMAHIPSDVNLLPPAYRGNKKRLKYKKLCSARSICARVGAYIRKWTKKNAYVVTQMNEKDTVRFCRSLDNEYDIAIAGMELWPLYYVHKNVKAKKKLAWVHVDYEKTGLDRTIDFESFSGMDEIITISKACEQSFIRVFPELAKKVSYRENIVSRDLILAMAQEPCNLAVDKRKCNFVTVARLDNKSKAFDRTIPILGRIVSEMKCTDWHWYIIGDGPDRSGIEALIDSCKLGAYIELLGEQINPYKYEKDCDYFLLLSYYEGKPISVTEAQILGLTPIVTNYASAAEQIAHGKSGIICENSEEGIYACLREIAASKGTANR